MCLETVLIVSRRECSECRQSLLQPHNQTVCKVFIPRRTGSGPDQRFVKWYKQLQPLRRFNGLWTNGERKSVIGELPGYTFDEQEMLITIQFFSRHTSTHVQTHTHTHTLVRTNMRPHVTRTRRTRSDFKAVTLWIASAILKQADLVNREKDSRFERRAV